MPKITVVDIKHAALAAEIAKSVADLTACTYPGAVTYHAIGAQVNAQLAKWDADNGRDALGRLRNTAEYARVAVRAYRRLPSMPERTEHPAVQKWTPYTLGMFLPADADPAVEHD